MTREQPKWQNEQDSNAMGKSAPRLESPERQTTFWLKSSSRKNMMTSEQPKWRNEQDSNAKGKSAPRLESPERQTKIWLKYKTRLFSNSGG